METTLEVLRIGLIGIQVCTNADGWLVPGLADVEHPTGISSRWEHDEENPPVDCDEKEGFKHYILLC